jgi:hypothetical protein
LSEGARRVLGASDLALELPEELACQRYLRASLVKDPLLSEPSSERQADTSATSPAASDFVTELVTERRYRSRAASRVKQVLDLL